MLRDEIIKKSKIDLSLRDTSYKGLSATYNSIKDEIVTYDPLQEVFIFVESKEIKEEASYVTTENYPISRDNLCVITNGQNCEIEILNKYNENSIPTKYKY